LTELALELSRVEPKDIRGCLPKSRVKKKIAEVIKELRDSILRYPIEENENLKRYIGSVLNEICP
jgi:CRISPR/Cas system-associated endoribonuclease Cas2